jgi:macrolide transport system ATP-binding/permease protein
MRRLRAAMVRLSGIFSRRRHEQSIADEIGSHLQMHIDDNLRAGMAPDLARREALLKLGGLESAKQACRERATVPVLDHLVLDVRFAIRQLGKNPGFTFTAIVMLALGIGVSVAIFGFVDAALIKPLPYANPSELVHVTERTAQIPRAALSYLDYLDWKRLNTVFRSLDVYNGRSFMLTTPAGMQLVPGARVSDGFFRTLGVTPLLGRDFQPGEDLPGAPRTVILGHAAWQTRFGADPGVIGRTITLSGTSHVIVGVLPPDFQFAPRGRAELWTTLHAAGSCDTRRSCHNLEGIGRLQDGVTVKAALAAMSSIAQQLEMQYPESNRNQGASVLPLSAVMVGDLGSILLTLLGGAGLLLVIACVNVMSLLLVRSESRRRELAVRSALGASAGRLFSQFVTEGSLLALAGGGLGLATADWIMRLLTGLIPPEMMANMPYLRDLGLHGRVVAAAASISLIAAIAFSIAPALRLSASGGSNAMSDGSRWSASMAWHRLGFKLVIVELATAVVLLVGAGLLGRSLYQLLHVDLGFQPDRLATMSVVAPPSVFKSDEQRVAVAREVERRVAGLPGVTSVGLTSVLPLSGNGNTDWIRFVGRAFHGEHNEVNQRDVSVDYFKTLETRLLRGRHFTEADTASAPRVAIINQALARLYFPGEDPIGKRIGDTSLSPDSIKEIVGMVDDVREATLDTEIWPAVYYPFSQDPDAAFSLVVRTTLPEESILATLRSAVHEVGSSLGTSSESTMQSKIAGSQAAYLGRSSAWLAGGFAALALLLGVIGLYGVIAYSVSQRTRELGVRFALGAQRNSVYRLILGEAGLLAAAGIGSGLLCSLAAASLMRRMLFETPPWHLPTLLGVSAVLALAALVASYIPARRAASVNPITALRTE